MKFVPYRGEEVEEGEVYTVAPVPDFPKFNVTTRYVDRKTWAKIAKRRGMRPDEGDFVALNEVGEAHCLEALVGWEGTETLVDANGGPLFKDWPDGMPVNPDTSKTMARFLCESILEVIGDEGKKVAKTLWVVVQDEVVKKKTVERKNS